MDMSVGGAPGSTGYVDLCLRPEWVVLIGSHFCKSVSTAVARSRLGLPFVTDRIYRHSLRQVYGPQDFILAFC